MLHPLLKKNPGMQVHVFSFTLGTHSYAPLICYIKEVKPGHKRAEIVHIPPILDTDYHFLIQVLRSVEQFFFQQGVEHITSLASNDYFLDMFKQLGYRILRRTRPVVVKGDEDVIENLTGTLVHLSLAESDKSVRNI
jgi:hypothetical protein